MSQPDRRTRLAELDQQIPQLRLLLERLEEERIQVIESLTFPILTLPVEVTTEIFLRCLPPPPCKPRISDAPLLLVCICRQWRDIAISTPQLWASLAFAVSEPNTELHAARDQLLERWLARSGQHPFAIRVIQPPVKQRYGPRNALANAKSIDSCLRLLLEHPVQWRHIEIEVDLPGMKRALEAVKSHTPLDFPRLEHLRIGVDGYESQDSGQFRVGAAPQLRSIHLTLGLEPLDFTGTGIPWSQLTDFTGNQFEPSECLFILRLCPALVRGCFDFTFPSIIPCSPIPPHASLKSLGLTHNSACPSDHIFRVLDAVTLPALESLALNCVKNGESIVSFLTRSSYSLHELTLHYNNESNEQHWDCLLIVPQLRSLCISGSSPSTWTGIFTRLTDNSEVLSNLQSLSIHDQYIGEKFPFDELFLLLTSRNDHPALQHFRFTGRCYEEEVLDLSRFTKLNLEGIKIQIRIEYPRLCKRVSETQRFPEGGFPEAANDDEDKPIFPHLR